MFNEAQYVQPLGVVEGERQCALKLNEEPTEDKSDNKHFLNQKIYSLANNFR